MGFWDAGILLVLLISILVGLFRGFIHEALALFRWIIGFILAKEYALVVGNQLPGSLHGPVVGFVVVFVLVFLFFLVIGYFLNAIVIATKLGSLNRIGGGFFGFLRALLLCGIVIMLSEAVGFNQTEEWQNSKFIPPLKRALNDFNIQKSRLWVTYFN